MVILPVWKGSASVMNRRGFTWSVFTFFKSESARTPAIRTPSLISCQGQKQAEREREREMKRNCLIDFGQYAVLAIFEP